MAKKQDGKWKVSWIDLTVDDAARVKEFYMEVVGWAPDPINMGGYADYNMISPADGTPVASISHPRATSISMPPQWLVYVEVQNLEASIRSCLELGGSMVSWPKDMVEPGKRWCVVKDPAGAVLALVEKTG
ncbi:MAG: VOC family protein [Actinomycetota bacterium]